MVHARQHSSGFITSSKIQSSYPDMICAYSPTSTYSSTINESENWAMSESSSNASPLYVVVYSSETDTGSNQQYCGTESYTENNYSRRWIQETPNYSRRESRGDSRGSHHSSRSLDAQTLAQSEFSPSPFLGSAQAPRSSSFSCSNSRDPVELPSNTSNWMSSQWDDPEPSPLLNNNRYSTGPSAWNNNQQLNIHIPLNSQPFGDILYLSDSSSATPFTPPGDQSIPLNGFAFPHRFSPGLSPSPSPVQQHLGSTASSSSSRHSRRHSEERSDGKSCSHCHATSTPLWRRDPSTMKPLCNACGLYLQQRNKLRPQELIDADDDGNTSEESDANYVGPECSHCRTHHTSVWRRSKTGEQLCNACGVYARLRGKPRPLSLKRNKIRPRSKHLPK